MASSRSSRMLATSSRRHRGARLGAGLARADGQSAALGHARLDQVGEGRAAGHPVGPPRTTRAGSATATSGSRSSAIGRPVRRGRPGRRELGEGCGQVGAFRSFIIAGSPSRSVKSAASGSIAAAERGTQVPDLASRPGRAALRPPTVASRRRGRRPATGRRSLGTLADLRPWWQVHVVLEDHAQAGGLFDLGARATLGPAGERVGEREPVLAVVEGSWTPMATMLTDSRATPAARQAALTARVTSLAGERTPTAVGRTTTGCSASVGRRAPPRSGPRAC